MIPLPHHYFSFLGGIFIVENGKQKGIYFKVSEEERNLIEQKMALAGIHNMSGFIRKMSIDGYVINLEIPELASCEKLLRYISNNVNRALVRAIANPTWQSGSKTLILRVIH
ncbi:hypothetical protein AALC17_10870, partial [Oscillospiraceae bacterium 38-13]